MNNRIAHRWLTAIAPPLLFVAAMDAQAAERLRTYANPVDIDYRYNFEQVNERISYRTGADPVIVRHDDAYYLFMTLADGYWRSTNLLDWKFITPTRWPIGSIVAPAVLVEGDRLILMPSMDSPAPIFETRDPASGKLDLLTRVTPVLPDSMYVAPGATLPPGKVPPGPNDPDLFRDDDGRTYLYFGSSNVFPIYGLEVELRHGLRYIGTPRPLLRLDPARHGWERFGRDQRGDDVLPFVEGAWMNKVGGRYYLQYAAPGTEFNAYATGTYVGASPFGPFIYANNNPVGYKPGGFVEGVGHGNTFFDAHGNAWNTGTSWIGVNWPFERRIGLYPARFDDGGMHVNTRFGDFPHVMPTTKVDDPDSLFAGWMLLSYRKHATASSTLGSTHAGEFDAANVTDEDPRTFWVAARNEPGQTLTLDLGAIKTLRAVQVDFADYQSDRYADAGDIYTEFRLEHSLDARDWHALAATTGERRDRPNAYFELEAPVRARYVRYVHGHVGAAHLAISDLRVFGTVGGVAAPSIPVNISARRSADPRAMVVSWNPVTGAVGYNVRWGLKPDRLEQCYQVFADRGTRLEVRSLNAGVEYDVAVEAFDENGVSSLSRVVHVH